METRLGINPALGGLKHLNRLEQVLGARERTFAGWDEGLMLDAAGRVIGGTMSNLFLVRSDRLTTPDVATCGVAGVMRGRVKAAAADLGLQVTEEALTPDLLGTADELFLTNALLGVWPVAHLADRRWTPGPITRRLMDQVT